MYMYWTLDHDSETCTVNIGFVGNVFFETGQGHAVRIRKFHGGCPGPYPPRGRFNAPRYVVIC